MKKKIFLTAAIAAVMALSLAGCGVKVTDMAIPETATIEKGESVTLPINFGTDKAPAETPVLVTGDAATAESADVDEKLAAAAEKLTIEWTSSNEDVATVDENGVVTAVGAGETDITAAVQDADISSVTHVKVVILPTGVDAPDTLELYTNGESEKSLDAKIVPEDATEVKLAYVSSDEGVATVDENGLVTAVADGKCTITAYDHTADASIPDARITTGMANRDNVSLSTTVVDGYYADSNGNRVSDAGGPYKIVRESELTLVGNGSTNYYIGTEDYSGSISARGLYVHSLYLEDPTYPRNIKHYDGTTNATIKDILIDGILEGDDVKLASETASGKYKTKDAGQKLNAEGKRSSRKKQKKDDDTPVTRTNAFQPNAKTQADEEDSSLVEKSIPFQTEAETRKERPKPTRTEHKKSSKTDAQTESLFGRDFQNRTKSGSGGSKKRSSSKKAQTIQSDGEQMRFDESNTDVIKCKV